MTRTRTPALLLAAALSGVATSSAGAQTVTADERAACAALMDIASLTITQAGVREADGGQSYCYVRGIIPPAIGFHVQIPLKERWNGRFLMWGDGGKDGDLDFADHRLAEGYAVANTNMGHDGGAEPGSSFGFNNRQSEIDFGYRAVHLTVLAGKELVNAYYGRSETYAYFEGCSTGGREGLMEAQRYPFDFDGIVAGAPAHLYQDLNAGRTLLLQNMYRDRFAGSLSFDTDGDGLPDSPRKVELLAEAVLAKCDAIDGIEDGVIDNPPACDFDPAVDLAHLMCRNDVNGDACFTRLQLRHIQGFYSGPRDSTGKRVYPGHPLGSEAQWMGLYVPHAGNRYTAGALGVTGDHLNYLFYEDDPGVPPQSLADLSVVPRTTGTPPEWAWWQFDVDDITRGKGDLMKTITDANDPDLTPFLETNGGKLILYHGWSDGLITPVGTVEYYEEMVNRTFAGNEDAARERVRLFMIPGMGHCSGGPGPNTWDKLPPLVEWVERGTAPDAIVAEHRSGGVVDNARPIYPYPDQAVYSGPAGRQDDPTTWVPANFRREPR